MATLGTGIVPSGAIGAELSYITRRAFIPEVINSVYGASPIMAALIANAKTAMGGISGVTVPAQGAAMTSTQWSGFSGTFSAPGYTQGIWNLEFNLKLAITPIAFVGPEALVQDMHAIVPRIQVVMNDATNNMVDAFATAVTSNTTDTSAFIGIPAAVDDGTNVDVYGGLSRATYTWLKSYYVANRGASPTRALVMQDIASVFKQGSEMPNFGVMGLGTWLALAQEFVGKEEFRVMPNGASFDQLEGGAKSGFVACSVMGVPIFADPYITEGQHILWNTNYFALYLHHMARFDFTGFYSTMPNWQLGYVGAVCTAGELVNAKPKSCGRFLGYTAVSI